MMTTMDMPQLPSGEYVNRAEYNRRMGVDDMPAQRIRPISPQQQQMANMRARDMAMAQMDSRGTPISYGGESPGFGRGTERQPAYQPATQDQPQIRPYRTEPADRVGVPSMSQLMSGIYGGMGGGFNPYMGGGMGRGMGRGMGFGGFNPYMGGGGMGFGGFNPYMGGRGMGRGGFNPYMAQPQPMPMPKQRPDFARQMYGIGQRTNPYASMERIMPYVPPRQAGPGGISIMPVAESSFFPRFRESGLTGNV